MPKPRAPPRLPAAMWPALRFATNIRRAKRRAPANVLELDHEGNVVDATHQMALRLGAGAKQTLAPGKTVPTSPARALLGKNLLRDLASDDPHSRAFFQHVLDEARKPRPITIPPVELAPTIVTHRTLNGGEADALVRAQVIPQGKNAPSRVALQFHNLDDLISRGRLVSDIFGISADISKESDLREAMKKLANNLSRASGNRGDRAFVFVAYHDNGNGLELIPSDNAFQHGLKKEKFEKQKVVEVGKGLIGRAFQEGRVLEEQNIRKLPKDQRALSDVDETLKITNSRAVPLIAEDSEGNRHAIGVISINLSEKLPGAKTFKDYERTLHDFFAQSAALKLKDIRLLTHDELTGLANRRGLNQTLAKLIAQPGDGKALRVRTNPPEPLDVHYIDFNGFKKYVNDVHGHSVGDALLEHVARSVFSTYKAARLAGDEFLAILPHESPEDAARTREKIIADVKNAISTHYGRSHPDLADAADNGKLGVSIGTLSLTNHAPPLPLDPWHKIRSTNEFHNEYAQRGFRQYAQALEKTAEELMYAHKKKVGAER